MKKLLLIPLIFLITGCSVDYTLEINENDIKENIKINAINIKESEIKKIEDVLDNGATVITDSKKEIPYYNVSKLYNNYKLDYNFKKGEIGLSNIMNSCFESKIIEDTDSYYMIALYDKFKCNFNNEEINITLKTRNKVTKHNSKDYDTENGIYKWKINKDNKNNVDIKFIVLKNDVTQVLFTSKTLVKNIIFISVLIINFIFSLYALKRVFDIKRKIEG